MMGLKGHMQGYASLAREEMECVVWWKKPVRRGPSRDNKQAATQWPLTLRVRRLDCAAGSIWHRMYVRRNVV